MIRSVSSNAKPVVFLVDDDLSVLNTLTGSIEDYGFAVKAYSSALDFLSQYENEHGCLVLDLVLPEMDGHQLQAELARRGCDIPIIFITGHGAVADSVAAMRSGALHFLEKPFRTDVLLTSIKEGIEVDAKNKQRMEKESEMLQRIASLTDRERSVFDLLVGSDDPPSSKAIARAFGISHRTVEHHRSRILEKLGLNSVVELRSLNGPRIGSV